MKYSYAEKRTAGIFQKPKGGETEVSLKLVRQDEVVVIHLLVDIDMEEVVSIRNAIASSVEGGCYQFVLDFTCVQHINMTGIGILVESLRKLRDLNGDLRISNLNMQLHHALELTGVLKIFRIFKHQQAAVASYKHLNRVAA